MRGTAFTAPSTCTVHVNLDTGVNGEFSTSTYEWSRYHCDRPPIAPTRCTPLLGAQVPYPNYMWKVERSLPMPTSRLHRNISLYKWHLSILGGSSTAGTSRGGRVEKYMEKSHPKNMVMETHGCDFSIYFSIWSFQYGMNISGQIIIFH